MGKRNKNKTFGAVKIKKKVLVDSLKRAREAYRQKKAEMQQEQQVNSPNENIDSDLIKAVHEVLIKPDPDALEQEDDTNCGSEYTDINSSSMFGGKTDVNDIVPILREMSSHLQKMANKQEDSFESFGKYVANTLRNMPERNSMELQLQIVNLLIADQNKINLPTNAGEKS